MYRKGGREEEEAKEEKGMSLWCIYKHVQAKKAKQNEGEQKSDGGVSSRRFEPFSLAGGRETTRNVSISSIICRYVVRISQHILVMHCTIYSYYI